MKKLILFELNEVPMRVFDLYCDENPDSALANFRRDGLLAETVSPDTQWLHPWCTWPTLHRGVDANKHMLTNLSQDLTEVDEAYPPLWKILAENGVRVGLGGSLHSWPMPSDLANYDFYLPDTFASDGQAHPDALRAFQTFNIAMVDKSARNVSKGIAFRESFDVLKNYRELGIGARTLRDVSTQLATEVIKPARKGRRRILQAVLAFDAFMQQLSSKQPSFATFFTNHVASSMHRYWIAKFPGDFANSEYDQSFVETYSGEIDYAMSVADAFADRLRTFVDQNSDYAIVMTTSMGQAASQEKVIERQVYVDDPDRFMSMLGVATDEFLRRRVMAPRFACIVQESKLPLVREAAAQLRIAGERVRFEERNGGFCMFHFGQENIAREAEFLDLGNQRMKFENAGLKNTTIEDAAGSTGYHIPEGILLTYDPMNKSERSIKTEVATTEIAPMILSRFGVAPPSHMQQTHSLTI